MYTCNYGHTNKECTEYATNFGAACFASWQHNAWVSKDKFPQLSYPCVFKVKELNTPLFDQMMELPYFQSSIHKILPWDKKAKVLKAVGAQGREEYVTYVFRNDQHALQTRNVCNWLRHCDEQRAQWAAGDYLLAKGYPAQVALMLVGPWTKLGYGYQFNPYWAGHSCLDDEATLDQVVWWAREGYAGELLPAKKGQSFADLFCMPYSIKEDSKGFNYAMFRGCQEGGGLYRNWKGHGLKSIEKAADALIALVEQTEFEYV